ncbi:MAG TPA: LacI family DNA-binding transcriptional regulator [Propionibacteriaceae bacterium]|nr:LacI family DNA-binding transcriptional regulator [Propionibacteriaceae bacterium]
MSSIEPSKGHPASIRDVARLAGVSHQTVSRVINGHPSLRPETRDRVLAVIDQLQYRPNRVARALGSSKSGTIGVLVAQRSQYGPSAAIQGIERAASEAGYLVNITNLTANTPDAIREALELQIDHMVDGIVIIAPQARTLNQIDQMALDVPYVMLHSRSKNDPHEMFVDQLAGARAATRHLLDLGHRDIYHLAGPQEWIEAEARMQGFLQELSDCDMPATPPILGDWTADFGYHAGTELAKIRDFTAVFSSNDQMALGLLHAFRDAGIDVPGDVSVVGFDDMPEARHFAPPLTTVRQDFEELGHQCVSRLLSMYSAAPIGSPVPLAPRLVIRSSTAPPWRGRR